jgi:4-amino-4-deoxy-L-arabinose transferase-like glycosyltransferase
MLSGTLETMSQRIAERCLHWTLLFCALILCLMRFAYLRADFPNHSPWMIDQAKFTDEGWWASAAVRHFLIGHWQVPGDYNPAAVVPVWPALVTLVFHITGVSITAVRSVSVSFSIATVALVYFLVRRYDVSRTLASLAALLLAASSFAFAFGRLATLDTVIVFEWTLLMWVASYASPLQIWPVLALGIGIPVMVLTKTTALVLLPAVLWLLWKKSPRAILAVIPIAGIVNATYLFLVLRSGYADDFHYFFEINALASVEIGRTGSFLQQLFRHGLWIDRVLYPATMAAFLLSLLWRRQLWRNPLFTACWIALLGNAVYILRRQDDYAPRYFLVMLVPVIITLIIALQELNIRHRNLAALLAVTLGVALVLNTVQVFEFLAHRQYQFYSAAKSIRAIVDAEPNVHRLLLGTSGDQLALMVGIPSINDGYSNQDLDKKALVYRPGWYVGWNDLDQDILNSLSAYRLDEVANFPVFDREDRDRLKLYRMVPR